MLAFLIENEYDNKRKSSIKVQSALFSGRLYFYDKKSIKLFYNPKISK